ELDGYRRGTVGAVDAVADSQHVHGCGRAHQGDRHLDGEPVGRDRTRSDRGRTAAGSVLVGVGVPHQRADHPRPARRRATCGARVPQPRQAPARSGQCRPGIRGDLAGRVGDQGRGGGSWCHAACLDRAGRRDGRDGRMRLPAHGGCGCARRVGSPATIVFVIRPRRIADPLVDIGLFANPRFTGAIIGAGLAMFALVGVMLYKAQYLQLVAGLSPLLAGLAILPVMVAVGTMAVLSSVFVQRFGYATVFGVGAAIAATGMLAFSEIPADGGLPLAIIASAFIGAGIVPMMTLATDVVVGSAPPERSGAASALSETASEFGAALGIAILGSIGTALYRSRALDGIP